MFGWRSEIIIRKLVFMQRVRVRCLLISQLLQPIEGSAFWHEWLQLCGAETLPDCWRLHPKSTDCVRLHPLWCWPLLLYFLFFFYMDVIKKSAIDRQRCGFWVGFFFFFSSIISETWRVKSAACLYQTFSGHGSTLSADRKDVEVVLFSWKGTSISFIIFHNYYRGSCQDADCAKVRLAGHHYREYPSGSSGAAF